MPVKPFAVPADPSLADALDIHTRGTLLQLACHHIGVIQSFDETTQTAKVAIAYKRTFFEPDASGVLQAVPVAYPVIADAPVIFLGGGGYSLTFPVDEGDECLVLFNDRDIDNWFAGLSSGTPNSSRLHSFSDAVILVGLRSLQNVILGFDTDGLVLRDKAGTTKLKLSEGTITGDTGASTFTLDDSKAEIAFGETEVTLEASQATIAIGPDMTIVVNNVGQVTITNSSGTELLAALQQIFTGSTAGGFPFIPNPAGLTAFETYVG